MYGDKDTQLVQGFIPENLRRKCLKVGDDALGRSSSSTGENMRFPFQRWLD